MENPIIPPGVYRAPLGLVSSTLGKVAPKNWVLVSQQCVSVKISENKNCLIWLLEQGWTLQWTKVLLRAWPLQWAGALHWVLKMHWAQLVTPACMSFQ